MLGRRIEFLLLKKVCYLWDLNVAAGSSIWTVEMELS